MIKTIPVIELNTWKDNFTKHPELPVMTTSAAISLDILKKYIASAEKDCPGVNGFRLYFVRYDLKADLSYISEAGNSGLSQVSLVFVPEKASGSGSADYPLPTNPSKIVALTVCEPTGGAWDDSTGLCPPKCNW